MHQQQQVVVAGAGVDLYPQSAVTLETIGGARALEKQKLDSCINEWFSKSEMLIQAIVVSSVCKSGPYVIFLCFANHRFYSRLMQLLWGDASDAAATAT